ncbi:hypothetical protein [Bradyrhizobium sp. Ce-3]|uniref:hypothetical protein n=1 Tax=Bradyrhizobium sp. Ce-3 TaxID=2913970 RepID=UPI001FC81F33|nr:hypothetical protein [Bradyrhizobium sp. Ce-3]GKQ55708.1 hypothetical protein BRSPCE3_65630 [Bradyrhizobium sp. Ce-3]
MGRANFLAGFSLVAAVFAAATACAGFRSPESLIRNVYAHYGQGSAEFSNGLPRDEETARRFFDPALRRAWTALHDAPYDFLVQSPSWRLGPISIAIPRRQFDRTDVTVTFDNEGRAVTLNFVVVNSPDGWVISDVESPHDSLRMFLVQFRR